MVNCNVGNPKTLARRKPIPLAYRPAHNFGEHRERTAYKGDADWVFASPYKDGEEPYWPDSALENFVKPAVKIAGITKRVGWHTFGHSYSCLLRPNHTDVKVQSELLRHSNIGTTLDVYTQAVRAEKRAANGRIFGQLLAV